MTRTRKKEIEQAQLQRFRECWPGFPTGEIEPQEEPDFLVRAGDTTIGIELRDYLCDEVEGKGSPSKRQESLRSLTVANAAQEYESQGLPPVDVSVLWNDQLPLTSRGAKNLISRLLELVIQNLPRFGSRIFLGYPGPEWRNLPAEIIALWIDRCRDQRQNFWASHGGGAIPQVGITDIEQAIRLKEKKLPTYRRAADEVWLLVVASGFTPSGFCSIAPELVNHSFETSFDRLFFLQYADRQALELNNGST